MTPTAILSDFGLRVANLVPLQRNSSLGKGEINPFSKQFSKCERISLTKLHVRKLKVAGLKQSRLKTPQSYELGCC